jgi:hypothetical protein
MGGPFKNGSIGGLLDLRRFDGSTELEAQATLIAERQKYANRYGEIIQNLDSYRKKSTIPGTGKVILGIIFIATFVFDFSPQNSALILPVIYSSQSR